MVPLVTMRLKAGSKAGAGVGEAARREQVAICVVVDDDAG